MTKSKAIEETDFAIIMARERVLSIRNQKQTTSRLVPFVTTLVLFLITFVVVDGQNLDRFNYVSTKSNDYGPSDWQKVKCQNVDSCVSYNTTLHFQCHFFLSFHFFLLFLTFFFLYISLFLF